MTTVVDQKQFTEEDLPLLVKEVRRLAEAYPDFVYDKGSRCICDNLAGGCDLYPELCGCIIGQAVRNIGFIIRNEYSGKPAEELLYEIGLPRGSRCRNKNPPFISWLSFVQAKQDGQHEWARAVTLADLEYVTVAEPREARIKVSKTDRGFNVVNAERYAIENGRLSRLVQESSAIGDYADSLEKPGSSSLWVGQNHHLNREEVAELVGYMQRWLDTGSLQEASSDE